MFPMIFLYIPVSLERAGLPCFSLSGRVFPLCHDSFLGTLNFVVLPWRWKILTWNYEKALASASFVSDVGDAEQVVTMGHQS